MSYSNQTKRKYKETTITYRHIKLIDHLEEWGKLLLFRIVFNIYLANMKYVKNFHKGGRK
jgi:hypothetical protein